MSQVVITDCACINRDGFGTSRFWSPWSPSSGPGPGLRWRTFSQRPFARFGRLDLLCKYGVAVVEMLRLPPPTDGQTRPDVAVFLGSENGSLDVDLRFLRTIHEPGGASPALFTYTLPSTALGEIAMRHGITGPNVCFMAGPESGLLALWEGAALVAGADAAGCICLGCDALSEVATDTPGGYACAFLIEDAAKAREREAKALAFVHVASAQRAGAPAQSGCDPRGAMWQLFRLLACNDGKGGGGALYLPAPRTLKLSHVMSICRPDRRPDGRTG